MAKEHLRDRVTHEAAHGFLGFQHFLFVRHPNRLVDTVSYPLLMFPYDITKIKSCNLEITRH